MAMFPKTRIAVGKKKVRWPGEGPRGLGQEAFEIFSGKK